MEQKSLQNSDAMRKKSLQILNIAIIALVWAIFIISAENYKQFSFYAWLVLSRELMATIGLVMILIVNFNNLKYELDTLYIFISLIIQTTHGIFEPATSADFYNFTGLWYLLLALSYTGTFKNWLKIYFTGSLICLLMPIAVKDKNIVGSLVDFIDHCSLPIASFVIGSIIAKLNSNRFESIIKYAQLNKQYSILASQVAHDIRSPLSALEMIVSQLNQLPEDRRIIIRNAVNRIRDIANSLSNKHPVANDAIHEYTSNASEDVETSLLLPIIETIITEKRVQYRDNLKLSIEFNQTKESYGLFASINPNEFKRIISNIINNSVESLTQSSGIINVVLKDAEQELIEVSISDNGIGIPTEVLGQLGNRGFTYGKDNGSGLGLHHAISQLEAWGGKLNISSQENNGTTVTILLPKKPSPAWFVPKLKLSRDAKVVIFDDDQTIHQIWNDRLLSYCDSNNISIVHLSTPIELRKYFGNHFSEIESNLFLIDYEILNSIETGLSLIEELGIQSQSILVTSRYEESSIRSRCEGQKIRLIPKTMSGFVPIEIVS